jgi:hypothetical protein
MDAATKPNVLEQVNLITSILERLRDQLNNLPMSIKEDCKKLLEPAVQIATRRKLEAEGAIDKLHSIVTRIDGLRDDLDVAHADVNRLSKDLSLRERLMFNLHDTAVPYGAAVLAIILCSRHVVEAAIVSFPTLSGR